MAAKRWTFTGNYAAFKDGQKLGPWVAGDTVEFEHDVAAWVYRDCPGIIEEEAKPEPKAEVETESRAKKAAPSNRQHRGSRDRGA